MTHKIALHDFEAITANAGLERVRTDYSGRGMYGASCIAIIGGPGELVSFVQATCDHVNDMIDYAVEGYAQGTRAELQALKALRGGLGTVRSDDMGLQTVYYWPDFQIADQ